MRDIHTIIAEIPENHGSRRDIIVKDDGEPEQTAHTTALCVREDIPPVIVFQGVHLPEQGRRTHSELIAIIKIAVSSLMHGTTP